MKSIKQLLPKSFCTFKALLAFYVRILVPHKHSVCLFIALWIAYLESTNTLHSAEPVFGRFRTLETGERLQKQTVKWDWITFSPDGRLLIADGEVADNSGLKHVGMTRETREHVSLWNLTTYRHIAAEMTPDNQARRLVPRFTQDGKVIYAHARENQIRDSVANGDGRLRGAANRTGILHWPMTETTPYTSSLLAAPDGLIIASHMKGNELLSIQASVGILIYDVEIKPAHKDKNGGRVREYASFKVRPNTQALPEPVQQPAMFSFDGSTVVASVKDGEPGIVVWDVKQKQLIARLSVAVDLPKGKKNAKSKNREAKTEKKTDAEDQKTDQRSVELIAASDNANVVAFALEGPQGWLAHVFNPSNPQPIASVGPFNAKISALSLSSTGDRLLYVTGGDAFVREVSSGKQAKLIDDELELDVASISPDGNTVVASANNGLLQLWNDTTYWNKRVQPQEVETVKKLDAIPALKLPTPKPATPEQIEWYHILHCRRMLGRALNFSSSPTSLRELDELRTIALERQKEIDKERGGNAVAISQLYGELANGLSELREVSQQIYSTEKLLNEQVLKFAAERTKEKSRRTVEVGIGLMTALASAFTVQREYIGTEQINGRTTDVYIEHELVPGMGEEGLRQMFTASYASNRRQEKLKALEAATNDETIKALSKALQQKDSLVNQLQSRWEKVAGSLGYSPPEESPTSKSPKFAEMLAVMEKDAQHIRSLSGRDDPFTLADLALMKSPPPSTLSVVDKAYFKSGELLKLVASVPEGKLFDSDRAELLGLAALEINRVAEASATNKKFLEVNEKKCLLAISLLNLALQLNPTDRTGMLREQKAITLLHLRQIPDAIAIATERTKLPK